MKQLSFFYEFIIRSGDRYRLKTNKKGMSDRNTPLNKNILKYKTASLLSVKLLGNIHQFKVHIYQVLFLYKPGYYSP